MKCSNTRTTQYNKIPNYITNPNLRLLTYKLQEEVEGLDQNVPVFPENTQKNTSMHVWKERHINNNMKQNIKTKINSNSPPKLDT